MQTRARFMITTAVTFGAALASLTSCSPLPAGVAAIGYDESGQLVGALMACHGSFVRAELARAAPSGAIPIAAWTRTPPIKHATEVWQLDESSSGSWTQTGPPLPTLDPGTTYVFWATVQPGQWSDDVYFTPRDLERVKPGEVLVGRFGPTTASGASSHTVEVIRLQDLSNEEC